jgi:chorismate-pyruvate lyase
MSYDVLNALDYPTRTQAIPFCIRDLLAILFYPRSLSRLSRHRFNQFKVECLHFECNTQLVRDVKIYTNQKIQMIARSRCNYASYLKVASQFSFTNSKPIGDFLFTSPDMRRINIRIEIWGAPKSWFSFYETENKIYWYRQSIWAYQKDSLLYLMEVFY